MSRCVIIGGAPITNYEAVAGELRGDDFVIYCDCGLRHQPGLGRKPDLIIGDFDSFDNPHSREETIVLPREKDDTDSVFAVKEGIRRGFEEFLLLGAVGARLDHTLANVSVLLMLEDMGKKGQIVDDYSVMEIVADTARVDDSYAYFSLLNISGVAKGITIENAKYPLQNGEITCQYQYGVSNEVLPGRVATITITEGRLLLVKVR